MKKIIDIYKISFIQCLIPLSIFIMALIPRILSLGITITSDERLWLVRSPGFIDSIVSGNLTGTFQQVHPGVTIMWLSGLSMELFYREGMAFSEKLLIASFPVALATSIGIVVIYFLAKKTFNQHIAIISSILLCLEPFIIGHSRVVQLDALLMTFMILSVLSLMAYLKNNKERYLLFISGIFAALAILSKFTALFLIPFSIFILIAWYLARDNGMIILKELFNKNNAVEILKIFSIFCIILILTFFILWPSMWVAPLDTIKKVMSGVEWASSTPHEYGNFFMGNITDEKLDAHYYLVVMLFRSTPLLLLFLLIGIAYTGIRALRKNITTNDKLIFILIAYIALFYAQMAIGSKQLDRYILPVFPAMAIIAASGIHDLAATLSHLLPSLKINVNNKKQIAAAFIMAPVIICNIIALTAVHPYCLSYYNPVIFGGPDNADNVLMVGWGDGMDIAARYLNQKPGAENMTVAAQYVCFQEYFNGHTVRLSDVVYRGKVYYADYIVFYVASVQREYNKEVWDAYKDKEPEKVITINGIEYCWIYKV